MKIKRRLLFIIICGLWTIIYAQNPDPIAPKLVVDGNIEIGANNSLRLKPVVGTAPASPQTGDLYFDGATFTLRTWDGNSWEVIAEQGHIFYDDATAALYYYDSNEAKWKLLGSGGVGGPKTVASRVVAAKDSLGGADYKCNGSADGVGDQKEINDAIQEVGGRGGGAVYLLEGTYEITGPINITKSNVSLIGTGSGTVLKATSPVGNILNVSLNGNAISGVFISKLKINGNSNANKGIYFNYVSYSKIDKIWVENCTVSGIELTDLSNNNIISGCTVCANSEGILLANSSNNNISDNNVSSNTGNNAGIRLAGAPNNTVCSNIVTSNQASGITLESGSNNNIISSNNVRLNGFRGIGVFGSNNIISNNNIRENNQWSGYTDYSGGIHIDSYSNVVSGNEIFSNKYTGILVEGWQDNIIMANVLFDNGATANYDGIKIDKAASNSLISSNRIYDSSGTGIGININNGGSNNYLVNNFIDGAGFSKPINDSGDSTFYTDKTKMTLEKKQIDIWTPGTPYDLDIVTYPQTYVALNPLVNIDLVLAYGRSVGDLLILENVASTGPLPGIGINECSNINLSSASHGLGKNDVLKLIWNGTKWVEIAYSDN